MKPLIHAAALLVLLGTAPAGAQPRDGAPAHRGAGDGPQAMMARLNLTDAQKEQIEKLRTEHQRKNIEVQSKIRLARLDMRELTRAENPDRTAIEKKTRAVHDLDLQMKMNRIDHMFAVRAVLTPEQRKQWKDEMPDRRPMGRGRGAGRGDGSGPHGCCGGHPGVE